MFNFLASSFELLISVSIILSLNMLTQISETFVPKQQIKDTQNFRLISSICNNCSHPVRFQTSTEERTGDIYITQEPSIRIVSPPQAVQLSKVGDVLLLYELTELLDNKDRGWAAFILIAQMTNNDSRVLNSNPEKWWKEQGINGREKKRWSGFLKSVGKDLYWNPNKNYFMYKESIKP
jgi:hypothetical protein